MNILISNFVVIFLFAVNSLASPACHTVLAESYKPKKVFNSAQLYVFEYLASALLAKRIRDPKSTSWRLEGFSNLRFDDAELVARSRVKKMKTKDLQKLKSEVYWSLYTFLKQIKAKQPIRNFFRKRSIDMTHEMSLAIENLFDHDFSSAEEIDELSEFVAANIEAIMINAQVNDFKRSSIASELVNQYKERTALGKGMRLLFSMTLVSAAYTSQASDPVFYGLIGVSFYHMLSIALGNDDTSLGPISFFRSDIGDDIRARFASDADAD